jgi:hypothetical protein
LEVVSVRHRYEFVQKWTVFGMAAPVLVDDGLVVLPVREGEFAYWKRKSSTHPFELESSLSVPFDPYTFRRTAANRNFFVHSRPSAAADGLQTGEVDIYTKVGETWTVTKTLRDDSVQTQHSFGSYTSLSRTFLAIADRPDLNANITFFSHDTDGDIVKDGVLLPPLDGTQVEAFWVNESRLFRFCEYGPSSRVRLDTYTRDPVSRAWNHEAVYDPPSGTTIEKTFFGAADRGDRIYMVGSMRSVPNASRRVITVATLTTAGWTTATQIVLGVDAPVQSIAAANGILFVGSSKSVLIYQEVRINDWRLIDQIPHTPVIPEANSTIEMIACNNRILIFAAGDWDDRNPADPRFLGKTVYCYQQGY